MSFISTSKASLRDALSLNYSDLETKRIFEKTCPDDLDQTDKEGRTALYIAVYMDKIEMANQIVDKMTPQGKGFEHKCTLYRAPESVLHLTISRAINCMGIPKKQEKYLELAKKIAKKTSSEGLKIFVNGCPIQVYCKFNGLPQIFAS